MDLSDDGSVVVGRADSSLAYGRRDLQVLLARAHPARTQGCARLVAVDLSGDGRLVVGAGLNPDGNLEGWIARLPIDVEIDIRPGDPENSIPTSKPLRLPVSVLGSETFDATSIDAATLQFGPDRAAPEIMPAPRLRDVNADGYLDFVSFFRGDAAGIAAGDTEACLLGDSVAGERLLGCDTIRGLHD